MTFCQMLRFYNISPLMGTLKRTRAMDHCTAIRWLVHWPLMSTLRCTKCNSPPINSQSINFIFCYVTIEVPLPSKGFTVQRRQGPIQRHIKQTIHVQYTSVSLLWNWRWRWDNWKTSDFWVGIDQFTPVFPRNTSTSSWIRVAHGPQPKFGGG